MSTQNCSNEEKSFVLELSCSRLVKFRLVNRLCVGHRSRLCDGKITRAMSCNMGLRQLARIAQSDSD